MTELTQRKDGDRIAYGDRHARFMLPVNRNGSWVTKEFNGRTVECVTSNLGDVCADDQRAYEGHPEKYPPRSLMVFDLDQADTRQPGQRMRMAFDFVLYPNGGPILPISADFLILAEYNAWPRQGVNWGPPPFALDLHYDRASGQESLFAVIQGAYETKSLPVTRSISHHVEAEFVFTAGESGGMARVTLDGAVIVDYVGPTGRPGYSGVFPAYGLYGTPWRPRNEAIAVNFENFREGIV
jgi:hypothetical protein